MSLLDAVRHRTPLPFKRVVHAARRQQQMVRVLRQYARDGGVAASVRAVVGLNLWPPRTVLFYPSFPDHTQVVYKLCVLNGFRMTNDPERPHDVVHKHVDQTVSGTYAPVEQAGARAINAAPTDIRKERVQEVFREVFRYDLGVDPRTYHGRAVRKSDTNCRHDGAIVECPYEPGPEEDIVYQKFVDTERPDGTCVDFRVPIYGGEVPIVYLKIKPAHERFATIMHAEVVDPLEAFSAEELVQLGAFSRAMGLEYAEMDVLRDNLDGQIYIVDVNNTPAGPVRGFTAEQKRDVAERLAASYRRLVERCAAAPAAPPEPKRASSRTPAHAIPVHDQR